MGKDGKLRIRDLKSRNGTIVNKAKIEETDLQSQDTFRLGRTVFVVLTLLDSETLEPIPPVIRAPLGREENETEKAGEVSGEKQSADHAAKNTPVARPKAAPLGSVLLNQWPNNFRSLRQESLANFIDHLDKDQRQNSRRLVSPARRIASRCPD